VLPTVVPSTKSAVPPAITSRSQSTKAPNRAHPKSCIFGRALHGCLRPKTHDSPREEQEPGSFRTHAGPVAFSLALTPLGFMYFSARGLAVGAQKYMKTSVSIQAAAIRPVVPRWGPGFTIARSTHAGLTV